MNYARLVVDFQLSQFCPAWPRNYWPEFCPGLDVQISHTTIPELD